MMIEKVDNTLKNYLLKELGNPGDTELDFSFKLPDRSWVKSTKSSKNWINIYLLEVRENLELRKNEWQKEYQSDKVKQKKHPLFVDLYYLITFYNKDKKSEIEHQYLESVLIALSDFSNLVQTHITDSGFLKQVRLELFPKPYIDDQLGFQLWSALDQEARPYIPLKITVPLESEVSRVDSIVASKTIDYKQLDSVTYHLKGRVIYKSEIVDVNSNKKEVIVPVISAVINLKNKGGDTISTKTTDSLGKFEFEQVVNEKLIVEIIAEGYKQKEIDLDEISKAPTKSIIIAMEKV